VRKHEYSSRDEDTIIIKVHFNEITDFTDLFLADVLHDHFKGRDNTVLITEAELECLILAIAEGTGGSAKEIGESFKGIIPHAVDRKYEIRNLEFLINDHYRSSFYESKKYIDMNQHYTADTCRRSSDSTICREYELNAHRVVTLATINDPGFITEHVDYDYCQSNRDYFAVDCRIHLMYKNKIFSRINYYNDRTMTFYDENTAAYAIPDRTARLRDVVEKLLKYPSTLRKKRIVNIFNIMLIKFHGDFAQILYARVVNEDPKLQYDYGKLFVITNDRIMGIISAVMAGNTIYRSKYRLEPRSGSAYIHAERELLRKIDE
jgi:hypothetical protein